jgi:hypothetical protein
MLEAEGDALGRNFYKEIWKLQPSRGKANLLNSVSAVVSSDSTKKVHLSFLKLKQ